MSIGSYIPARPKTLLKSWRGRLHSALIRRFCAFTAADLLQALRELGVRPGDVLFAHTSYEHFAGFEGGIGDAIKVLQDAVGEEGTLLLPTLPFSGSALDYVNSTQITDLKKAPSCMGFLTEIFRRLPGVTRSIHPTHPVAAWGRHSEALVEGHAHAASPCGVGTPFHKLLEMDGKILFAGTSIHAMTFYHCIEELLENRLPVAPFTDKVYELRTRDKNGELHTTANRLFEPTVSRRRDCGRMVPYLRQRSVWHETRVGRLPLIVLSAREVLETTEAMLEDGVHCYALEHSSH